MMTWLVWLPTIYWSRLSLLCITLSLVTLSSASRNTSCCVLDTP